MGLLIETYNGNVNGGLSFLAAKIKDRRFVSKNVRQILVYDIDHEKLWQHIANGD